jgi:hypothetical protein
MDRLLRMSKEQFIEQMRAEVDRVFGQIADAVNDAPDGQVINGSETKVRDLMAGLRTRAYEKALQMRIDSTESSFSPSAGRVGAAQAEQGPERSDGADGQRPGGVAADAVARGGRRRR